MKIRAPFLLLLPILLTAVACFGCSDDGDTPDGDTADQQRTRAIMDMLPGDESYREDCGDAPMASLPSCEAENLWGISLKDKAAYYDAIAAKYHVPQDHDLMVGITLSEDLPLGDDTRPSSLAADDIPAVAAHHMGDNDGYWTGMYLSSQAFRYASTGGAEKAEALANVKRTLTGIQRQMLITGVEGLFCRTYYSPYIKTDPPEVDNVKWIAGTGEYGNFIWKADVSKDEYSGQMFTLGVLLEVIDDQEVRDIATDMLRQVGDHLIDHNMTIVDPDGVMTKHGDVWVNSLSGLFYPGFNASLALSWIKLAAIATGDEKFTHWYDRCLLKITGESLDGCVPDTSIAPTEDPYPWYQENGFNLYFSGCDENYNNFSMAYLAMYNLAGYEENEELKAFYQWVIEERVWQNQEDSVPRDIRVQKNSFFNFITAARSRCGLRNAAIRQGVEEGICTLQRFIPTKYQRRTDTSDLPLSDCYNRFDDPTHIDPVPVERRKTDIFVWTRNPYNVQQQDENRRSITGPADYLLAYWMGRYFGYIDASW